MQNVKRLLSITTAASVLLPGMIFAATSVEDMDDDPTLTTQSSESTDEFLRLFTAPNATGDGFVFDQTAFRSHPCFEAVGDEVDYCLNMFGVTTNFGGEVASDTDDDEADSEDDDDGLDLDMHERAVIEHNESVINDGNEESLSIRERAAQRSQHLWALCADDDLGQSGCYQNFIRLVTSDDLSIDDIEDLFDFSHDDNDEDANEEEDDEDKNANDDEEDEVQSETDADVSGSMTRQDKAEWLWSTCEESAEGQASCYRRHYRTVIDEMTDLDVLEQDIR